MGEHGRTVRLPTTAVLAAGMLLGGVVPGAADAGAVDRPNPKERTTPGTRPDPRCDRAQQGLDIAKANVAKAKEKLNAAPKKRKPAKRAKLKAAKQSRVLAKARVARYC